MHFERTEDGYACTLDSNPPVSITKEEFDHAHEHFFDAVEELGHVIDAIGVRAVAPGTYFTRDRVVDAVYLAELARVSLYDPAHTEPLHTFLSLLYTTYSPRHIPVLAISDSAFHHTLPEEVTTIPIPAENRGDFVKTGYHGLSLASVARRVGSHARVVVCHLGSGASVTALRDGKSIETSMGYSPLDGLIMSSRSGALDPAVVAHLAAGKDVQEVLQILYKESGLKALSGRSDDMRVLLAHERSDEKAALAIRAFVHRIVMYIGAYSALLGGIDAVVFSGTIGERSAPIREKVCASLAHMGIELDAEKNHHVPRDGAIHAAHSRPVIVCHADEVGEIARAARVLLENENA
jgi:acetate kinase